MPAPPGIGFQGDWSPRSSSIAIAQRFRLLRLSAGFREGEFCRAGASCCSARLFEAHQRHKLRMALNSEGSGPGAYRRSRASPPRLPMGVSGHRRRGIESDGAAAHHAQVGRGEGHTTRDAFGVSRLVRRAVRRSARGDRGGPLRMWCATRPRRPMRGRTFQQDLQSGSWRTRKYETARYR